SKLFIPLTIGGGISTIDDISSLLNHGADKISLNSSALNNPSFIKEASEKFVNQCFCITINSNWDEDKKDWYCYNYSWIIGKYKMKNLKNNKYVKQLSVNVKMINKTGIIIHMVERKELINVC